MCASFPSLGPQRTKVLALCGFILLLFVWTSSLSHAHAVTGRVLDGVSERPIILAELTLVDSVGTVHDRTLSNQDGFFQLGADQPGAFYILANALGYKPALDGILDLGEGGSIPIAFYLRPEPIELEPLTATVERTRMERHLVNQGYYTRKEAGFGHFITPEELEYTSASHVVDLIDRIIGVQKLGTQLGLGLFFRATNPGSSRLGTRKGRAPDPPGYCTPDVYMDGKKTESPQSKSVPGARLNLILELGDVLAVEVYTRISSTPLQYSILNTCGVILIWTK